MKKLLFVDDEQNVLDGIRRMMFPLRNEWDMHFATSGQKALEIMETESFDVVITDMRMPGMDGIELLNEVSRLYPGTVRMVLSGQTDQDAIIESGRVGHQFLSKPCDADTMRTVLADTLAIDTMIANDQTKRIITSLESLPSLPHTYERVTDLLAKDEASVKNLARVIAEDVGMSTNILKYVNSSFFGLKNNVVNPEQAVTLLGVDVIRGLMLTCHIFTMLDKDKIRRYAVERLQQHTLGVSRIARSIAGQLGLDKETSDRTFTAALLHDVGKLVLMSNFDVTYGVVVDEAKAQKRSVWDIEMEVLGTTHAEIGGYLLGLWGLPTEIIRAVARHHAPGLSTSAEPNELTCVHLANHFEHSVASSIRDEGVGHTLDMSYIARLGLENRIPEFRQAALNILQEVADE